MIGALLAMAGCNTIAGFGQDITDSARAVQRVL
jgi:predicted small secreted protein